MDILQIKKHLELASSKDISLLQRYYQFNDVSRPDALWLIALSIFSDATITTANMFESIGMLDFDDYFNIESMIGKGSYGIIYKVKLKKDYPGTKLKTGDIVVAKQIKISFFTSESIGEIEILKKISEVDNCKLGVSCYYDHFKIEKDNEKYLIILMEYIEGETVCNLIENKTSLTMATLIHYMKTLATTLLSIHTLNIVHRDIKPENIIIRKKDDIPIYIDFGFSCLTIPTHEYTCQKELKGTPFFFSPELVKAFFNSKTGSLYIDTDEHLFKLFKTSDIWALGLCFYELLFSRLPKELDTTVFSTFAKNLKSAKPISFYDITDSPHKNLEPALLNIVKQMLDKDPIRRITLQELVDNLNVLQMLGSIPVIDLMDYFTIIKQIGKGSFGKIQLVQLNKDYAGLSIGQKVALKLIRITKTSYKNIYQVLAEIKILELLSQEKESGKCKLNISCYYHHFRTIINNYEYIAILMEYIEGRELFKHIETMQAFKTFIPIHKVILYMKSLAHTLRLIHQNNITHRDIKAENIILNDKTKLPTIIDFGLSCITIPDSIFTCPRDIRGSPLYTSPEMIKASSIELQSFSNTELYNIYRSSDIWALGIVFYVIVFLDFPPEYKPYGSKEDLFDKIISNAPISFYDTPPYENIIGIIKGMLNKDPNNRSTLDDVIHQLENLTTHANMNGHYDDIIIDDYFELKKIGRGTYGTSYKAKLIKDYPINDHETLKIDRIIAVKMIKKAHDEMAVKEATILMELSKEPVLNISRYYDYFPTTFKGKDYTAILMEYIEGDNLEVIIDSNKTKNTPFPKESVISYMKSLIQTLLSLHVRDIVHRDIKPANIIIRKTDNIPIFIDFGLSCFTNPKHNFSCIRDIQGSYYYISPELLKSKFKFSSYTDEQLYTLYRTTDIWSLGMVFYNLLFLREPQEYTTADEYSIVKTITSDTPISFYYDETIDKNLIDIVKGMLNKDPSKRSSLNDVMYRLNAII